MHNTNTIVKKFRSPSVEDLAAAVSPLIQHESGWGIIVHTDEDQAMRAFVLFHKFVMDNPHYDYMMDGADAWDLADLSKWRQPLPAEWSPRRCRIRLDAEDRVAACLAGLEKCLYEPAVFDAAAAAVDYALRHGTAAKSPRHQNHDHPQTVSG